jgi:putative ABC transport system permease protein
MSSTRWRKVRADLWSNKTRTLLVVLSIAVGVFAIGTIMGTSTVLSREMSSSYQAINPANIYVWASEVDDDMIRAVDRMPEVKDVEGRTVYYVRVKVGPGEWKRLSLTAVADWDAMRVEKIWPESGAWPPPAREVLIERGSLDYIKAQVGDSLLIESPDGTQREMRIAGLVHDISKGAPLFE